MEVLCLGNEFIEDDKLCLELADELEIPGITFTKCTIDHFLDAAQTERKLIILDVADIDSIRRITDPSYLSNRNMMTNHDLDLSFYIKLLHELDKLPEIEIIAVPKDIAKDKVRKDIIRYLQYSRSHTHGSPS
ncbi:MAG: hypothetical protein R6V53_05680 [Candidatus Woesearchaeota archaeon]